MELDKGAFALFVNENESVHTESLHHTERSWNCSIRHDPHEHVCRLGMHIYEVPEVIMGRLRCRDLIVWLRLDSVNLVQLVARPDNG